MQVLIEERRHVWWFTLSIGAVTGHAIRLVDLAAQLHPCFAALRSPRSRCCAALAVDRSEPVDRRHFIHIDVKDVQARVEGPSMPLRASQMAWHRDVALKAWRCID